MDVTKAEMEAERIRSNERIAKRKKVKKTMPPMKAPAIKKPVVKKKVVKKKVKKKVVKKRPTRNIFRSRTEAINAAVRKQTGGKK